MVSNSPGDISPVVIRKCTDLEELRACVQLQKEVWGFDDADLVPLRMFVVAEKVGGQIIGAFAEGTLVGYALSIPGSRNGRTYLHSHMLAVRNSHRNSGLGRRLKLAQRDDALQRGFELIEWTFDPLEIKNAYLNITRLGAITRRYSVNHYGLSSSVLHRGLPTDRLTAEWWLKSDRVRGWLESGVKPAVEVLEKIETPAEIYAWRVSPADLPKAAAVQHRNQLRFLDAFSRELAVLGYELDPAGNGTYLLGRWNENWTMEDSH